MSNQLMTFKFGNNDIQFKMYDNKEIMVNVTQMCKLFNKRVDGFLENKNTNQFIEEILNNGNSRYINLNNVNMLYVSNQKTAIHKETEIIFEDSQKSLA